MANNTTPLQALFEKGDLPGITQADVVNQAHPGYIGPIPEDQLPRNLFQEQYDANMHNFGIDEEMLFDIATGSGAPMAIGSVAKGGSSLLQRLLAKARQDRAIQKSITRHKNKPQYNFETRKTDRMYDMDQEQMMRGYKNRGPEEPIHSWPGNPEDPIYW